MEIITKRIEFSTKGYNEIINITDQVQKQLNNLDLNEGQVTIFAVGSTTGITTLEYEPGLVEHDVKEMLEKLAPYGEHYKHNETWGDDNGPSHLRSSLIKTSLTVPFVNRELTLGTWQQIVFIDFDTRPRNRTVITQFLGK